MKAYLDIETSFEKEITIVGVFRPEYGLVQLHDDSLSASNLLEALEGTEAIYTYNGSRFDLPVISNRMGLDLTGMFESRDLMYDCWRHNLYGGLKKVEQVLGIERELPGMDGYHAMVLWARYQMFDDRQALEKLLLYNKEDIINLPVLEEKLELLDIASDLGGFVAEGYVELEN